MSHIETIICPECETIQDAEVEHTPIWNIYVHECISCKHIIMESEWLTNINQNAVNNQHESESSNE